MNESYFGVLLVTYSIKTRGAGEYSVQCRVSWFEEGDEKERDKKKKRLGSKLQSINRVII